MSLFFVIVVFLSSLVVEGSRCRSHSRTAVAHPTLKMAQACPCTHLPATSIVPRNILPLCVCCTPHLLYTPISVRVVCFCLTVGHQSAPSIKSIINLHDDGPITINARPPVRHITAGCTWWRFTILGAVFVCSRSIANKAR